MRAVQYNLDHYGIFSINLETKFNPDTCLKLLHSCRSKDVFSLISLIKKIIDRASILVLHELFRSILFVLLCKMYSIIL